MCEWNSFRSTSGSELSTFYRNFALKDALSSREVHCQHFTMNVNVSTRFSRAKVEFLLSKVKCQRIIQIDCSSGVIVERKLDSGTAVGIWLSTRAISQEFEFCCCERSVGVFACHFRYRDCTLFRYHNCSFGEY